MRDCGARGSATSVERSGAADGQPLVETSDPLVGEEVGRDRLPRFGGIDPTGSFDENYP